MKANSVKYYFFLLLLTIILMYIVCHFIGIFPDEHTECEFSIHHNGIFLSSPVTIFNNKNVFTIISYPIVFLKNIFTYINIHTCILIFFSYIYITNYLYLISLTIKKDYTKFLKKDFVILMPIIIIIITILYNEIFYLQYVKVALHLTFSGIMLFNFSKNNFIKAIGFLSAIFGVLIRYETFMIVTPLLILVYLLFFKCNITKKDILLKIKRNIAFVVITIVIIIICSFNITKADKIYQPYHGIVNTIADFRYNDVDTTNKSKLDLSKLKMIQNYYYNDVKNLNPKEAQKLGINPMSRNPFLLIKDFNLSYSINRGVFDFIKFLENNYKYIIIYLTAFLLTLLIIFNKKIWKHLLFLIFGYCFLFLICFYMEIKDRFAMPILSFIFIANLIVTLNNCKIYNIYKLFILYILMLFLFTLNTYNNYFKIKIFQEINIQTKNVAKTLNDKTKYEVVFWDFYLWNVLNNNVASNFPLYNKDRDYSIDFPFGFALDEYKNRLQTKFSTSDFYGVINQSVQNKKFVYFYTEEHLNTIIDYINLQYNRKIIINKLSETPLYSDKFKTPNIKYYLFYLSEE